MSRASVRQQFYNLLNGRAENPRPSTVEKLERALHEPLAAEFKEEIKEESEIQGIEGVGSFQDFNPHVPAEWPSEPGVYVFYDIRKFPVYVGQGGNIADRIKHHHTQKWFIPPYVQNASYLRIEDKPMRSGIEKILLKFMKGFAVINRQNVDRE
jgi:hypothetical protein